jgi:NUMOD3 motif
VKMIKKRARKCDGGCSSSVLLDIACSCPLSFSSVADSVARKNETFDENKRHPGWYADSIGRQRFSLKRRKISFLFVNCCLRFTSDRLLSSRQYFFNVKSRTIMSLIVLLMILGLNHGNKAFSVSAWSSFPIFTQHERPMSVTASIRSRRIFLFQKHRLLLDDSYQCDMLTLYCSIAEEGEIGVKRSNSSRNVDSFWIQKPDDVDDDEDVPRPTENGGYSHTQASRAKISAANKGKTPWNKGVQRPEEVKARIAAGVRAKNRERFLLKLQGMGITEEEYEEQKRKDRNAKEAERRSRRTDKGGYRPTEETKRKISEILKQKFAKGEIKPRFIQPVHVRRGFTHSEETRQKISDSLRRRWATDAEYRAKMVEMSNRVNSSEDVRRKISDSLKQKWQSDDEFRLEMLTKIASRKPRMDSHEGTHGGHTYTDDHRARISAAMKAKWQDADYREKTLQALASRRVASPSNPVAGKAVARKDRANTLTAGNVSERKVSGTVQNQKLIAKSIGIAAPSSRGTTVKTPKPPKLVLDDGAGAIRPVQPKTSSLRKEMPLVQIARTDVFDARNKSFSSVGDAIGVNRKIMTTNPNEISISKVAKRLKDSEPGVLVDESRKTLGPVNETKMSKGTTPPDASTNAGSVDLLKAERRDLYDLLYGDDDRNEEDEYDDVVAMKPFHVNENVDALSSGKSSGTTLSSMLSQLDDENLDTFDPYGLDDF